jgi:anaerobic ribonucleoside-triphosphate reductase
VTSEATDVRIQESTEVTARDSVVVELRDTLVETTTITIDRNEVGDTLKVVQMTDRERFRDRSQLRDKSEKLIVKTDTVYIAVRDSVSSSRFKVSGDSLNPRPSTFIFTLKWIFWIVVAVIVLTVVIKVKS